MLLLAWPRRQNLPWLLVTIGSIVLVPANSGHATQFEGYTEPIRTMQVACDETGTVAEVLVREGQRVEKGQPLLRLNSEVERAHLRVTEQQMNAQGRLDAATAERQLTSQRLRQLESLRASGHARRSELQRARKEHEVAEANLRSVREEIRTRQLEHERLLAQLRRREVRAPAGGVITELHRDVGEFVAPNKPDVVTLVQIDALLASFALSAAQADRLSEGQTLAVYFFDADALMPGHVTYISPVTDAESGTVLVKIRVSNPDGTLRSGARCSISLDD